MALQQATARGNLKYCPIMGSAAAAVARSGQREAKQ
jgi:hypothetical protein